MEPQPFQWSGAFSQPIAQNPAPIPEWMDEWPSLAPAPVPQGLQSPQFGEMAPSLVASSINAPPALQTSNNGDNNAADVPRRIHPSEWESHRLTIKNLFPFKTLPQLQEIMTEKHGFTASEQQYKKKFKEWRLQKNLSNRQTKFIRRREYTRRVHEKKETQFTLAGEPLSMTKIKRHLQGNKDEPAPTTVSVPSDISWRTPPKVVLQPLGIEAPKKNDAQTQPTATVIMASYQGQTANQFVNLAQDAVSWTEKGDYIRAKAAFEESLAGLHDLLTATHSQTIAVLDSFVRAAVENDDVSLALQHLHKSYNDHSDALGATDRRTWQSLARLANAYVAQGNPDIALSMLKNARDGLQKATEPDGEAAWNYTIKITHDIIDLLTEQHDYAGAEEEYLQTILRVQSLGNSYADDVLELQHHLSHLYNLKEWKLAAKRGWTAPVSRDRFEGILLNITKQKILSQRLLNMYICSWEQLRHFYVSTWQTEKLEIFLPAAESFLSSLDNLETLDKEGFAKLLQLEKGLAITFEKLGHPDKSQWWILFRGQQIEQSEHYGSKSFELLSNHMHLGKVYAKLGSHDSAIESFKAAQSLGQELLPPDDPFHEMVAKASSSGKLERTSCCCDCLVRQPSKTNLSNFQKQVQYFQSRAARSEIPDNSTQSRSTRKAKLNKLLGKLKAVEQQVQGLVSQEEEDYECEGEPNREPNREPDGGSIEWESDDESVVIESDDESSDESECES
ncbi:hypothetical protein PG988_013841 [Apiospora saccharicola]